MGRGLQRVARSRAMLMTELEFTSSAVGIEGLTKLGEGRQAEVFVWPRGGVVKLYRSLDDFASARAEVAAMRAGQASGIPTPRLLDTVLIEQRPGVVMERLGGSDHLTLFGRKPWTIWPAAKKLAQLHAQLHSVSAPGGLRPLKEELQQRIEASVNVPQKQRALALAKLERLPEGSRMCHGDFHPGNLIETAGGTKVIDWATATRGDALADVARTLVILRAGALPPWTPFLVRKLTAVGRRVLLWRYLREYRRLHPFEHSELAAWEFVNVAARLTIGIPEENDYLMELLERES